MLTVLAVQTLGAGWGTEEGALGSPASQAHRGLDPLPARRPPPAGGAQR